MPKEGVEPSHLSAHEPESCVSANFTTWAIKFILKTGLKSQNNQTIHLPILNQVQMT